MDPQVAKPPVAAPPKAPPPQPKVRAFLANREGLRLVGAGLLGVLITVFAVLNLDSVDVNWLLGTWSTPLIVVIAVAAVFGMLIDRFLLLRSGRRKRARRSQSATEPR